MIRTGKQYIESLRDGREIWIDGEKVADVTTHPAFRESVRSIAGLYDLCGEAELREAMTVTEPETGEPINRCYQIPRSYSDLVGRRNAMKTWAEATCGFMGRTPDYKASMWVGFASTPDFFDQDGGDYSRNVRRHYRRLRDRDLFQAHTVVNPQIDRFSPASAQEEKFLYLGAVRERDDGIVVRGAKMLGTGAVLGDEILVSTMEPYGQDDEAYALSFAVPLSAPGLKLISRHSYSLGAKSVFDYPFSKRFDENDAILACEDVFVPWENVFVYRNPSLCFRQWTDTPGFTFMIHQGAVRFWTKLEFLSGLAIKIATANRSIDLPAVRASLGKLLGWMNAIKGLVMAAEANYERVAGGENGAVQPNRELTFSYRSIGPMIYPQFLEEIKTLAGGGLLQLPSSYKDLLAPGVSELVSRYVRSPRHPAPERIKLFKLAWDVLGSEFAGRHDQYERFYLGGSYAALPAAFRLSNTRACEALVDSALASYSLEEAIAEARGEPPERARKPVPRVPRTGAAERDGLIGRAQLEARTHSRKEAP